MRRLRWALIVWPGLPQLWLAGSSSGLALAAGFAGLVNLVFVSTRLWTEWLSPEARALVFIATAVVWVGSTVYARRWLANWHRNTNFADDEGLFNVAQSEYLKGNWFEAEAALRRLIAANSRDIEGRLLFASLLRQTGRFPEVGEQIAKLKRTDGSEHWQLEISRLEQRIATQQQQQTETDDEQAISEEQVSQAA